MALINILPSLALPRCVLNLPPSSWQVISSLLKWMGSNKVHLKSLHKWSSLSMQEIICLYPKHLSSHKGLRSICNMSALFMLSSHIPDVLLYLLDLWSPTLFSIWARMIFIYSPSIAPGTSPVPTQEGHWKKSNHLWQGIITAWQLLSWCFIISSFVSLFPLQDKQWAL